MQRNSPAPRARSHVIVSPLKNFNFVSTNKDPNDLVAIHIMGTAAKNVFDHLTGPQVKEESDGSAIYRTGVQVPAFKSPAKKLLPVNLS
jgi:hypothetical protein